MKSLRAGPVINHRVLAIIENEWSQLLRSKVVIFTTFAPPLLLVLTALLVLFLASWIPMPIVQTGPADVHGTVQQSALGSLNDIYSIRAALLSPFLVLFQIIPLVVPVTIASYSIIGEKQSRSLEALLATPVRTWELLLGKALAAALPGIIATWWTYVLFSLAAWLLLGVQVYQSVTASPAWVLTMVLLTPLLALMAVGLSIAISSRVKDPQSAQQLGSLLVLPLIGILVAQLMGAVSLGMGSIMGTALVVAFLDAILFVVSIRLFHRESILIRWR